MHTSGILRHATSSNLQQALVQNGEEVQYLLENVMTVVRKQLTTAQYGGGTHAQTQPAQNVTKSLDAIQSTYFGLSALLPFTMLCADLLSSRGLADRRRYFDVCKKVISVAQAIGDDMYIFVWIFR